MINLPKDTSVHFSLESDDGSRLRIDGKLEIDLWQPQARTKASTEAFLSKGSHRIEVDYFQWYHDAVLILQIKIRDEDGELIPIPSRYLSYPESDSTEALQAIVPG